MTLSINNVDAEKVWLFTQNADGTLSPAALSGGGGAGVSSFNALTGAVTISAGSNITLTPSGNNIVIASTGGSSLNFAAPEVPSGTINGTTGCTGYASILAYK
jgi:hypothetical protein